MCTLALMLYSIAVSMITALFSDTVIYGEWKTGRNIRAFTMALMNIPIKVGVFLRSVIVSVAGRHWICGQCHTDSGRNQRHQQPDYAHPGGRLRHRGRDLLFRVPAG